MNLRAAAAVLLALVLALGGCSSGSGDTSHDMAQDAIDGGSSDEVGELARAIVTTQTAEIRQMNELLDTL